MPQLQLISLLRMLLLLLGICWPTPSASEVVDRAECWVHREQLLVQCQALNSSTLQPLLQQQLQLAGASAPHHGAWVQELRVLDGRLPVLAAITPDNTTALSQLQVLQVVRCQIRQVRAEAMMQVAGSLRHLSLAHNKLVVIPASLALLERLEVLDLRHNAITRLSPLLASLPRLRHLKLDHNRIRQLTGWGAGASPGQTKHQLAMLTHLSLADNILHEVWGEALSGLSSLQTLDLSQNLIQRLPPALTVPETLMELDLRDNPWYCDCDATWLTNLQYRAEPHALLVALPLCGAPHYLRKQPLAALTATELCNGWNNLNRTRTLPNDINDHQIKIAKVEARNFQLSWNVSNISQRGKKVQEYLGWRVTFRKFSETDESEVLLITLAGEEASRKTGTSVGYYTVQNLTPATGYMVCIQSLTDNEVNNIIETQSGARTEENAPDFVSSSPLQAPKFPKGRSLKIESTNEHPLSDVFRRELDIFWKDRLETLTTEVPETETTTFLPTTLPPTTPESDSPPITVQNFVYTNTGHRIPVNFGPSGSVVHPDIASGDSDSYPYNFGSGDPYNDDDSFIRSVPPPPPPPTNFGETGKSKFPFPFVRKKRSIGLPSIKGRGSCVEVMTEEEDAITMPVTVAATASSSTTMVILMICCCCFPKRCNKMRSCCIDKCKSVGKNTMIKTNSKTKIFVKPPKLEVQKKYKMNISASTPDLRLLASRDAVENEYHYLKLNKYYTMRSKELEKAIIEFFPGYDIPKSATAKYFGYDFPKPSLQHDSKWSPRAEMLLARRMSTDDNISPIEKDRFVYYNLNKFRANLNIPVEHCKYSDKIKGLNSHEYSPLKSPNYLDYQRPHPGFPPKIFNNEHQISPSSPIEYAKIVNIRSRSEPDLPSLTHLTHPKPPLYYNLLSKRSDVASVSPASHANPGYGVSLGRTSLEILRQRDVGLPQEAKLEIVKHIDLARPKRPTVLNISPQQNLDSTINTSVTSSNCHRTNTNSNHIFRITPNQNDISTDSNSSEPHRQYPNGTARHLQSPTTSSTVSPVGEVAITGGTLVEVPEGYVLPAKPRPINILRLKVPADTYCMQ